MATFGQKIVILDASGNEYTVPLLLQGDGLTLTNQMQPFPGASHSGEKPPLLSRNLWDYLPVTKKSVGALEGEELIRRACRQVQTLTGWSIACWLKNGGPTGFHLSLRVERDSPCLIYEDQGDGMRLIQLRTGGTTETLGLTPGMWDRAQILALRPLQYLAAQLRDEVARND